MWRPLDWGVMATLTMSQVRREAGWKVLAGGELDASTAEDFRRQIEDVLASGSGDVLLDLCALQFIDSTGLHTLLNTQRRLVRQNRHLRVECVSGPVLRLFELARLAETFDVAVREYPVEADRSPADA